MNPRHIPTFDSDNCDRTRDVRTNKIRKIEVLWNGDDLDATFFFEGSEEPFGEREFLGGSPTREALSEIANIIWGLAVEDREFVFRSGATVEPESGSAYKYVQLKEGYLVFDVSIDHDQMADREEAISAGFVCFGEKTRAYGESHTLGVGSLEHDADNLQQLFDLSRK